MVKIRGPDDVGRAVEEADDYLSMRMTSISKFYTYFYLVEEEGIDELSFDLKQHSEHFKDALYNYAVYVATSELHHKSKFFRIDNVEGLQITDPLRYISKKQGRTQKPRKTIENEIQSLRGDLREEISTHAPQEARRLIENIMLEVNVPIDGAIHGVDGVKRDWEVMTGETVNRMRYLGMNVFDPDNNYLEALEFIYSHDWDEQMDRRGYSGDNGWMRNYGGDAWGSLCKTAQLYTEFGSNSYVDIMLSVEHNNGNFLDKWPNTSRDDIENLIKALDLNMTFGEFREDWKPDKAVEKILDLAKETDLGLLFDIAKEDERRLRRYSHLIPRKKELVFDPTIGEIMEEFDNG